MPAPNYHRCELYCVSADCDAVYQMVFEARCLSRGLFPPGVVPGGELTGMYVQEGVLRWGCGGAEPPRSRPAQRKKMGSIGCLKRFSTED